MKKVLMNERPITVCVCSLDTDFDHDSNHVLDMRSHFEGLKLVKGSWGGIIQEIEDFLYSTIKAHGRYNLYMPLHSSLAFMVGRILDPKTGAEINIFEPSPVDTLELWRFSQLDDVGDYHPWTLKDFPTGNLNGSELAAAISIIHNTLSDVQSFIDERDIPISHLVHLQMDHPNPRAIENESQAYSAAYQAVALLKEKRNQCNASKLHLFLSAPNVINFLMGQQSRLLGRIQLYERIESGKPGYFPAFSI